MVATWLRDLSDGYVSLDLDGENGLHRGAHARTVRGDRCQRRRTSSGVCCSARRSRCGRGQALVCRSRAPASRRKRCLPFEWNEPEDPPVKHTALYETHKSLGAKMVPFAGWEMPVWYTSVVEEHLATRQAAGLFDVSHMGVYEVAARMRPPSWIRSAPTTAAGCCPASRSTPTS